jgi:D-alanyl-D-alanine carboxypeptidase/D-alanyl-D-alanine-endopeptidase (penicillin-binding protein 4)
MFSTLCITLNVYRREYEIIDVGVSSSAPERRSRRMRGRSTVIWPSAMLLIVALLLLPCGCGGTTGDPGRLPSAIEEIIGSLEFSYATWGIRVVDVESGDEVFTSLNQDIMLDPASTTKLFTVATGFDTLGADYRFQTPVYRQGEVGADGVLSGDLVLVASGDLAMGGRGALEGTIQYTAYDHNDANALGIGELTDGDPLAGLDELARQVAAGGIKEVAGDVIVDDRLYGPGHSFNPHEEYIITPIMINDNLIDLIIRPTQPGSPAEIDWRPRSAAYRVENGVVTADEGEQAGIEASSPTPGVISARGQVPAGGDEVIHTYYVEDPASFARTLFVEALRRAGVRVDAPETGENDAGSLPAEGSYTDTEEVALLASPPFKEYGKLILKVSHNLGADSVLCWVALQKGGKTTEDGLAVEHDFLTGAGVDTDGLILNDGQGAFGANFVSPVAAVQLLRHMSTRGDFGDYRDCLPVLGVDGSLANTLTDSPAAGNVQAKTGTHVGGDTMNQRMVMGARALGGYMVTSQGRELAFYVNVNNVPLGDMDEMMPLIEKHASILEAIYEEY